VAWTDDAFTSEQNDPTRVTFEPILDGAGNVVGQKEFCSASPCNDPVSRIEDRTIVNAKIGWQQPRWSAFLFARNLLDDDYRTQSNPLGADFVTGAPVQAVRTGEPRVVGVELNMSL
jgi:outer membrane receptor protein involved in Fe transport